MISFVATGEVLVVDFVARADKHTPARDGGGRAGAARKERLHRAHDAYAANDYAVAHDLAVEAEAAAEIEAGIRALREEAARRP